MCYVWNFDISKGLNSDKQSFFYFYFLSCHRVERKIFLFFIFFIFYGVGTLIRYGPLDPLLESKPHVTCTKSEKKKWKQACHLKCAKQIILFIEYWGAVLHCVMWLLWCERNHRVFEGQEVTSLDIKSRFLRTLFEWVSITTSPEFISLEEFLDSCNLT